MKKKTRTRIEELNTEVASLRQQKKSLDERLTRLLDAATAHRIQAIEAGLIPLDILTDLTEVWEVGSRPVITANIYAAPTEVDAFRRAVSKRRAHT